jgi:hypothetical protein
MYNDISTPRSVLDIRAHQSHERLVRDIHKLDPFKRLPKQKNMRKEFCLINYARHGTDQDGNDFES